MAPPLGLSAVSSCASFWHIFLLVSMVLEGMIIVNVEASGWLSGHATFYGTNQDPATLGKCHVLTK